MTCETTSKAAIERANELIADAPRDQTRSATFMALLAYIEHVDDVARDAFVLLDGMDDAAQTRADLMTLMLPDPEPDPLQEFESTKSGYDISFAEFRQALTAAGYEIRKVGND